MNIISNGLMKTGFVSIIPTMRSPQKMQYHHSSTPLSNLIHNNAFSAQNPNRKFNNPNIFNQNTHGENVPSNYNKKISHFEVPQNKETQKQEENSSGMISEEVEKTDFGGDIVVDEQKTNCASSRKRARKGKNKKKIPEKHNSKRQVLNEMMDMDFSIDISPDISCTVGTDDQDMDEHHPNTLKLCDVLLVPSHSSPIAVPIVNISMESPKLQGQACLAFSISPPSFRQRHLSTTESEDSFIVFDSGTDEECDFSEDAGSDSDDCSVDDSEAESDSDSPGSVVPTKKVRFADDKELCEVHPMVQWSYAYQAARKGPWEIYARDRERFKNRIQNVSNQIGHCFEPEHRQKVFDQRFAEKMDE